LHIAASRPGVRDLSFWMRRGGDPARRFDELPGFMREDLDGVAEADPDA